MRTYEGPHENIQNSAEQGMCSSNVFLEILTPFRELQVNALMRKQVEWMGQAWDSL